MRINTYWAAATALALAALAPFAQARAQTQPISSGQLQQLLLQNPELIRQRIRESGLSADEIRARLRADGYPDNLLDSYLDDASGSGAGSGVSGTAPLSTILAFGPGTPLDTGLIRRRDTSTSNVFGVDVFQRASARFLPDLSGPVPPDYRLGAGDQLVLILTGDVQKTYTLPVTRDGFILIPQVGQVFVSSLTLAQLREVLYDRLGRVYASVRRADGPDARTRFDLSVANVHASQIFVVGEVTQPGAYRISSLATVFTALYAAGGLTDKANLRRVDVQRLGKTVATLDLYDYLLRGDTRTDIRLQSGDVILVPLYQTRVQLTGAVVRPAIYEAKPGETLGELIDIAGGFRHDAALRRITIHRVLPSGRAAIDVALTPAPVPIASLTSLAPSPELRAPIIPNIGLIDGDSIVIDSVPPLDRSLFVTIAGMVTKPGRYPWREGMTLRDLSLLARGPTIGASLREAEIARLPADRTSGELAITLRVPLDSTYLLERDSLGRYLGPPGMPFSASGAPEVTLMPFDNVLILKQPEFDFQRTIVLTGEVHYPGPYTLRAKDERLSDVIARAGGLTQQAYAEGIRFVRPTRGAGRINIDLPRAMRDPRSRDNIMLQPGDSIDIPVFQASVKVSGAVNSPGSILWHEGESFDYYLNQAGGLKANADKKRASVQFANGETRAASGHLRPGPGSEIVVPDKAPSGKTDRIAMISGLAQITASLVALVVVLKQ
ncbi:MAG: hypothetical protein DMD62_04805 [Gemmatimonadetes bacterium]|nr:MAG: hypothetical protein DMD62_04805 [Gemmatimonadota bacterium]